MHLDLTAYNALPRRPGATRVPAVRQSVVIGRVASWARITCNECIVGARSSHSSVSTSARFLRFPPRAWNHRSGGRLGVVSSGALGAADAASGTGIRGLNGSIQRGLNQILERKERTVFCLLIAISLDRSSARASSRVLICPRSSSSDGRWRLAIWTWCTGGEERMRRQLYVYALFLYQDQPRQCDACCGAAAQNGTEHFGVCPVRPAVVDGCSLTSSSMTASGVCSGNKSEHRSSSSSHLDIIADDDSDTARQRRRSVLVRSWFSERRN